MIYSYEQFIEKKITEISKGGVVLDLGGGQRFQKWLARYRHLFNNCDYKTLDSDSSTGADILADLHDIPLDNESVDSVICSSVLEHVENPNLVVKEICRILKKGGKVFVYVPSVYPYHGRRGHYGDYWRFFEDTLRLIFNDFSSVEIEEKGKYFTALSHFFPFRVRFSFLLNPISYWLDKIFINKKRKTTTGYFLFAIK